MFLVKPLNVKGDGEKVHHLLPNDAYFVRKNPAARYLMTDIMSTLGRAKQKKWRIRASPPWSPSTLTIVDPIHIIRH